LVARSNTFPSYMAAGIAGAVLTLAITSLLGLLAGGPRGDLVTSDLAKRLAAVERTLQQPPAVPGGVRAKRTDAETRRAELEEQVEATQAKVAADAKALEARVDVSGLMARVTKLEAALATLSADDKGGSPRLADMEKLAGEASEAKAASGRAERDLAALKSEA